jgi:hypothetical protein
LPGAVGMVRRPHTSDQSIVNKRAAFIHKNRRMDDEVASSGDERSDSPIDRHAILSPAVKSVVAALGGLETSPDQKHRAYKLGDSCYGCLKDLKRFWRKDDTDDDRTVARIFWDTRVLINDLIPILLETVGKGDVQNRCGIACGRLLSCHATWDKPYLDSVASTSGSNYRHDVAYRPLRRAKRAG